VEPGVFPQEHDLVPDFIRDSRPFQISLANYKKIYESMESTIASFEQLKLMGIARPECSQNCASDTSVQLRSKARVQLHCGCYSRHVQCVVMKIKFNVPTVCCPNGLACPQGKGQPSYFTNLDWQLCVKTFLRSQDLFVLLK